MEIKTIISGILIAAGCFFFIVASIGVARFPDFYSRLHPAGKGDTLGQALILLGLIVYEGFTMISVKLAILMILICIANPTGTHFVTKAAYVAGVKPLLGKKRVDKTASGVDGAS